VFAAILLLAAAGALLASWRSVPFVWTPQLVLAVAGAAASEFFSFELAGITLSLAYPLVMCVIVLCGPAAAGIAAASTAVAVDDIRRRRPISILLFNVGQLVVSACAGGGTYMLLGGRALQSPPACLPRSPLATFPVFYTGWWGRR